MISRIAFFAFAVIVIFLVRENPFFWDTIQLGSKHAHFFYETDFQSIILPETIDSGHVPAFGIYLALIWKWFGKSLVVSHFAMLPFLFGILFFLFKIAEEIAPKKYAPLLVTLCVADPVLSAQSTLVGPDVALICFFLMAFWCTWKEKNHGLLIIAIMGLGLSSMRGMSLGVGLFFFYWIAGKDKVSLQSFFKKLWPFLPGGLVALAFLVYHYQQTGWIGYHENSTWAPSFERVDFLGFVKNLAVLTWRLLDMGRIFLWIALVLLGGLVWRKNRTLLFPTNSAPWRLLVLLLVVFISLVLNQLPYKGLLAHRYLMPVFLVLSFLFYHLLFSELAELPLIQKSRNVLWGIVVIGFVSGNFWIYPKKISQGWDSTLAHLHWFELYEKAEKFILDNNIGFEDVGTGFPNIGARENIELDGIKEGFKEKDLLNDCYVLYSNVMNDFSDEEIDELEAEWQELFHEERLGVCVILYQPKNQERCGN